jgi:hypothetical protein
MVEAARVLLGKMERGEVTGLMFVASTLNGDDVSGVYGAYADRLQYGIYSATRGLNALVEKAAITPGAGYSATEGLAGSHRAMDGLPSRLRKA